MSVKKTIKKLIDIYFGKNVLPFWGILLIDSVIVFLSSLFVYWVHNRTSVMYEHRFAVLYTALFYYGSRGKGSQYQEW